jgi:hypothetical protein
MMIGFSHKKSEIAFVLKILDMALKKIMQVGDLKNLEKLLEGKVAAPRTVRNTQ